MSRTFVWAIVAVLAAILLIGGTVWFLRSRNVGGLPAFLPSNQTSQTKQTLYDKPSNYVQKGAPVLPKQQGQYSSSSFDIPYLQLPPTLH